MNQFKKYYLQRSYPGDPFKSQTFLNEPEKIVQKLNNVNEELVSFLQQNPTVDIRETLFNFYQTNPQILTTIINEIRSEQQ